jgi:hypothetical protein
MIELCADLDCICGITLVCFFLLFCEAFYYIVVVFFVILYWVFSMRHSIVYFYVVVHVGYYVSFFCLIYEGNIMRTLMFEICADLDCISGISLDMLLFVVVMRFIP